MIVKPYLRDLYLVDQAINDRGVLVDLRVAENAVDFANREVKRLTAMARDLSGLPNPNSVPQLKKWITGQGVFVGESLDKKAVDKILKEDCPDNVREVLQIRQQLGRSSVAKYNKILQTVCSDGRVRGLYQFYGAMRTGRFAGRHVQFQNLRSNKLKDLDLARQVLVAGDYELMGLLFGNVLDTLSQLVRTAFISSQGVLSVSDFSAIEARVAAWFCQCAWRMEVFATHGKIYEASASTMYKIPMEEFLAYEARDEKHPARQKGKVAELLLGYGGTYNALINGGALEMGLKEEELWPLINDWRDANPEFKTTWNLLEKAAKVCIQNRVPVKCRFVEFRMSGPHLLMVMPNRLRALVYRNAQVVRGNIVYWGVDPDTKMWGLLKTWGGKLLENVCQAISLDYLAEALIEFERLSIPTVLHVHDEAGAEGKHLKKMLKVMSENKPWAPDLVMRGAGYLTPYYRKDD